MLLEAVGQHGLLVFEDGEVGLLEVVDGTALGVGDDDVEDGERDAGVDGICGGGWFALASGCRNWRSNLSLTRQRGCEDEH